MADELITRWTDAQLDRYNETGMRPSELPFIDPDDRAPNPNAHPITEGDVKQAANKLKRMLGIAPLAGVNQEEANICRARHYLTEPDPIFPFDE